MFSINSKYLDADDELEIISREQKGSLNWSFISDNVKPLLSAEKIDRGAETVKEIKVEPPVLGYIRDIIIATRNHGDVRLGASSRGSIALLRGSKALAAINGRTYVTPDDVKAVAHRVLQHRVILKYESEISSITTADVIDQILGTIEVP
jgi:MoxR-like ATPase